MEPASSWRRRAPQLQHNSLSMIDVLTRVSRRH